MESENVVINGYVNAVSIQKGGTGKTTITRNLGEGVSDKNRKVLLIDLDPQANLTSSFFGDDLPESVQKLSKPQTKRGVAIPQVGESNSYLLFDEFEIPEPIKINDHLFLIGSTKHLAECERAQAEVVFNFQNKMDVYREIFDDIFIDCPPSAGILQTSAHAGADHMIIPTRLDEDSINGVNDQILSAKSTRSKINRNLKVLGIVVNAKDSHKINIETSYFEKLRDDFGKLVFKTSITNSVKISEARTFNLTINKHLPKAVQSKEVSNLVSEYLDRVRSKTHSKQNEEFVESVN